MQRADEGMRALCLAENEENNKSLFDQVEALREELRQQRLVAALAREALASIKDAEKRDGVYISTIK